MTFALADKLAVLLVNSFFIFLMLIISRNIFKDRINQWFLISIVCIAGWANFAYLGYNSTNPSIATLFYKINFAFVAAFFLSEYMLFVECLLKINRNLIKFTVLIISLILCLLSLFTDTIIAGVVWKSWGNEIIFGPINDYFSLFALVLNIWLIVILVQKYFQFKADEKRKILYFLIGTFLFILLNIVFNIIVPTLQRTAQYQRLGDYSAVFFLFFTALAIVKREFLEIKGVFTTSVISIVSSSVLINILLFGTRPEEQALKLAVLIFFVFISTFILRDFSFDYKKEVDLVLSKGILKIWEEFLYSDHLVSFGAVGIVLSIILIFDLKISLLILVITYLVIQIIYKYNHFRELQFDMKSNPERVKHLSTKKKWIQLAPFLLLIVLSAILIFTNWPTTLVAAYITVTGILYTEYFKTVPILGFKNYYTSHFWAAVVLLVPSFYGISDVIPYIYLFIFIFIRGLVNTIFFDLKDIKDDKSRKLKTFPVLWGKNKTLFALQIVNLISIVPLILATYLGKIPPVNLFLIFSFLLGIIYLRKGKQMNAKSLRLFSYVIIDGEYIFWPIMILIGKVFI